MIWSIRSGSPSTRSTLRAVSPASALSARCPAALRLPGNGQVPHELGSVTVWSSVSRACAAKHYLETPFDHEIVEPRYSALGITLAEPRRGLSGVDGGERRLPSASS